MATTHNVKKTKKSCYPISHQPRNKIRLYQKKTKIGRTTLQITSRMYSLLERQLAHHTGYDRQKTTTIDGIILRPSEQKAG